MSFYILKEDGDYLLKEDGDKLLLEVFVLGILLKMLLYMQTYHDVSLYTETYHDLSVYTETYHDVIIWTGENDMTIRRDWQRGETVPIWAEVKLVSTGALYDPDQGVILTVTCKETGTAVVTAQAMTNISTGLYVYYWNTDADDTISWYKATGKAQDSTGATARVTIEHGGFQLQE